MFDWFWEFLYSISEILFELIDGLMSIANMLCGIEPITVDGSKTDFLSFLLNNEKILYGFIGAAFIGIFLIMVFSIFAMIKAIKGQTELTPARVAINVFKTLGIFLFVPAVMVGFSALVNELMIVLYNATTNGSASMGEFLCRSFMPSGMNTEGFFNWKSVDSVDAFISLNGYDLSDYRFFFSWLCCIPLLFALAKGLLNFVDRTISIVILFVVSPLSISTSIIDDGAHFKLWREQVLIKFLTGYGIIIGLNIYILIVSLISQSNVQFFENDFLNFLFKVAFILGGAVSLERTMALVGNLVSSGAGSNELRDAATAYNSMKGIAKGVGSLAKGIAKSPISLANGYNDLKHKGAKQSIAGALGLKTDRDYRQEGYIGNKKPIQEQILDAIVGLKDNGGAGNSDSNKIDTNPQIPEEKNNNEPTVGKNESTHKNQILNALEGDSIENKGKGK